MQGAGGHLVAGADHDRGPKPAFQNGIEPAQSRVEMKVTGIGHDVGGRDAGGVDRTAKAVIAFAGGVVILGPQQKGETAMAQGQQVLPELEAGGVLIHADAGSQGPGRRAGGDAYQGHLAGLDQGDQFGIVGKRRRQDHAVAAQGVDRPQDPFVTVRRIGKDQVHFHLQAVAAAAAQGPAFQHQIVPGQGMMVGFRIDQYDGVRAATGQQPRLGVRLEAQQVGGVLDRAPGGFRHQGAAVQHARHGGAADPGQGRDIGNRR